MVVVLELVGGPPHGILGVGVHDDVLVFGGAAGVHAGHDVDGAQLGQLALLIAGQSGIHLSVEQSLVGGIVDDLGGTGDAVMLQIDCHSTITSFIRFIYMKTQQGICLPPHIYRFYHTLSI